MWNHTQEKAEILSKLGDFWYKGVAEDNIPLINKLCHIPFLGRELRQFENLGLAVSTGGYYQDNYRVIRFQDKDISWGGQYVATQQQHVSDRSASGIATDSRRDVMEIGDTAFLQEGTGKNVGIPYEPIAFAKTGNPLTFSAAQQQVFELRIDPTIKVTSISMPGGKVIYEHIDFASQFGKLTFTQNPIHLFPEMKFLAQSSIHRKRNIYCYPFGVDIYGPIDRILEYTKRTQSPKSLYLAAAQAAGLAVIRKKCTVLSVSPLLDGVTYSTTEGRYDAPYPHTYYEANDVLDEGTVIGGNELYSLILPTDSRPEDLEYIRLDYALPVKNLIAPNKTITVFKNGKFAPQFEGPQEDLDAYQAWLDAHYIESEQWKTFPDKINAIDLVRNYMCPNRCIIACVNTGHILPDMYMSLLSFLRRELPLGSVLTTAPLRATISETNPVHV